MSDYILGVIPEKVNYYIVTNQSVGWQWSNSRIAKYDGAEKCKLTGVSWIFPSNASNKSTSATAQRRAQAWSTSWRQNAGSGKNTEKKVGLVTTDNAPMAGLRLVGVHYGPSNSIEYVVQLPGNYAMTMPYDSLMDAITIGGVEANGLLKGEYIFAQADGKMDLVRVGSAFHKAVVEATERSKSVRVGEFKLTPGRLYKDRSGRASLFVGFVNTMNFSIKFSDYQKQILERQYLKTVPDPKDYEAFKISRVDWKMATVWCDSYFSADENGKYNQKQIEKEVKVCFEKHNLYNIRLLKTHTYIEEVPDFEIDVPSTFFEQMRRHGNELIQTEISNAKPMGKGGQYDDYYNKLNFDHTAEAQLQQAAIEKLKTLGLPAPSLKDPELSHFRSIFKEEIGIAEDWRKKTLLEQKILAQSSWANIMIFGMPSIVNDEIEKIVKSHK